MFKDNLTTQLSPNMLQYVGFTYPINLLRRVLWLPQVQPPNEQHAANKFSLSTNNFINCQTT